MKYNETNQPLVCMLKGNPCYKKGQTMTIKGILWHDTGCNNPNLKRYVQPVDTDPNKAKLLSLLGTNNNKNDWNHTTRQVGVNAFVGKLANGEVAAVQTMPWNYRPWGCGSGLKGSCNNGWIQFEICEDGLTNKTYFDQAYKEAVELTAYLCKLYNIDPHGTVTMNGIKVPTILCHQDSYKLKLGSNHSDVYDWFNRYGKTMDSVRNDVASALQQAVAASPTQKDPEKEEEEEMTQAQFNQMLTTYFTQVAAQPASYIQEKDALDWAKSTGLMKGDENANLMPKSYITRGEVAIVLQRFAQMMGK